MRPRLLVLSGPLKDSTIPLSEGEVTLGRDSSNGIAIVDPSVSRKHCLIIGQSGRFKVQDLDSRNGTLVNRVPVEEQPLQHGDEIAAGDSTLLFLIEEEQDCVPASGRVEFDEADFTAETTIIHPRDAVYLQPDRLLRELPAASRVARNLNALLKISRIVHAIRDLDELQGQLLEQIFEVAPAGRGAILLADSESHQFNSLFARSRQAGKAPLVKVSRTIARQVLEQGIAILGSDVAGSDDLRQVESLASSQVRSLLCVPLTVFQRVIGCIYLDSEDLSSPLQEEHLQLVTAIAGISAVALENARRLHWLEQENERLTVEISQERSLVGEGERMKDVYQFLKRAAPTDSTVLIEGESGTGKELAARALHRNSPRASKPFMAINCAAIPETLLESDLFGYERGAFTGAATQKKGRLEIADEGVVFLDEIGELALSLQVKLLRVLQEREFERVGGNYPVKVDIRLIAATNCNLELAVREGRFRQDLYYRLAVLKITMPALRERREDIPMLSWTFVKEFANAMGKPIEEIADESLSALQAYHWPGNIRELRNVIERAMILNHGPRLCVKLGHATLRPIAVKATAGSLDEAERAIILQAVEQCNWRIRGSNGAAALLDVKPTTLESRIKKLGLSPRR